MHTEGKSKSIKNTSFTHGPELLYTCIFYPDGYYSDVIYRKTICNQAYILCIIYMKQIINYESVSNQVIDANAIERLNDKDSVKFPIDKKCVDLEVLFPPEN